MRRRLGAGGALLLPILLLLATAPVGHATMRGALATGFFGDVDLVQAGARAGHVTGTLRAVPGSTRSPGTLRMEIGDTTVTLQVGGATFRRTEEGREAGFEAVGVACPGGELRVVVGRFVIPAPGETAYLVLQSSEVSTTADGSRVRLGAARAQRFELGEGSVAIWVGPSWPVIAERPGLAGATG